MSGDDQTVALGIASYRLMSSFWEIMIAYMLIHGAVAYCSTSWLPIFQTMAIVGFIIVFGGIRYVHCVCEITFVTAVLVLAVENTKEIIQSDRTYQR
jgi:hypothetical protein